MEANSVDLADVSDDFDSVQVTENNLRCSGTTERGFPCNKFLTKIIFVLSISKEIRKAMSANNLLLSQVIPGLEIKIGAETKCTRCKNMDYKIQAI